MVTIGNLFVTSVTQTIPFLPIQLKGLRGARLPNGNLLVCGGGVLSRHDRHGFWIEQGLNSDYLLLEHSCKRWINLGTKKRARKYHSSIFYEKCLYTAGGLDSTNNATSHHEELSLNGIVKEKKALPIALHGHTANMLNQNKMLICGGSIQGKDGFSHRFQVNY